MNDPAEELFLICKPFVAPFIIAFFVTFLPSFLIVPIVNFLIKSDHLYSGYKEIYTLMFLVVWIAIALSR